MTLFGTPVPRVEDRALLTGVGRFIDDLVLAGSVHVAYVTSTMAHARVSSVDTTEASAMPGVLAVYTAADLDIGPYPHVNPAYPAQAQRPLLADDRVRFVGEAVAAVVAETRAQAEDAAELVIVDLDPLEAVTDMKTALDTPVRLYAELDSNIVLSAAGGDSEGHVDDCEVSIDLEILSARVAPCPLETRVGASFWNGDHLTHYSSCQGVHPVRNLLLAVYGLAPEQVRVISPEVGGSFGAKARPYPEELLLPWIARRVGRPVRWTPPRSQDMTGLGHSRAQVQRIRVGGRSDGTIEALDIELIVDSGAYPLIGANLGNSTGTLSAQVYRIPHIRWRFDAVATNTTPTTAYRGAGRPESAAMVERAVDAFSRHLGMDPVEVRRRNLIGADQFPYETPTGLVYDTGDYQALLDDLLEHLGYDDVRAEQARRRAQGDFLQLGVGFAMFVDRTAGVPGSDFAGAELRRDGTVLVRTASNPYGQGHHTSWAMLVADRTGLPLERIEVVHGDTDIIPKGGVTGGSRSVQRAGTAVAAAADELVVLAKVAAASMFEAAVDDIVLDIASGCFAVTGTPARALTWTDLASTAAPTGSEDAGLKCEVDIEGTSSYPSGAYAAVVEVDTETGGVRVVRFISVDDAGSILNPLLALGQVHGGIGQGIAQALTEEMIFDVDGTPVTSSFADYGIISAAELPSFESHLRETPTPNNPLGAKGIAESGTIGAPPAVQNAVIDALSHLGVTHIDMPCTARRVWEALADVR